MSTLQRARAGQAAVLTALAVVTVLGLALTLGSTAALLATITMPVPLFLLWMSTDVLRSDEKRPDARPAATRAFIRDRDTAA